MTQLATVAVLDAATSLPARAGTIACTAGDDQAGGTLSGVTNAYYAPPFGTLAAGSTSVPLGTLDTTGGGANAAIAANDELLIIQMQGGSFNSSNSPSYGGGTQGNAGLYEYVHVVSVSGGVATIQSTGTGGGLLNTYTESSASSSSGQQTYQIIRVPQYTTATLSSNFTAAYWDGRTGGVAALDMASTLNLGGASIYATGDGFRGGGVSVATGSPSTVLNPDYADSATMNGADPATNSPAQGFKGEGIMGTPDFTFGYTNFSAPSTPTGPTLNKATSGDGYPGGDVAMGAPGNAGGGGTDDDPSANDDNSGGGGGSNAGSGGNGGYPWVPQYSGSTAEYSLTVPGQHTYISYAVADATHNPDIGGRGAAAYVPQPTAVLMGGGGGAGSNNNNSNNNTYGAYGSSGGTGGGIVLLRLADTSGSPATIYARGTTGLAPQNDGGGGGGAGGTVVVTSPTTFSGITVHADGAAGTTANATASGSTQQHGPGGGGGGGVVLSSSPVTATVNGGLPGTTTNTPTTYGATAGAAGTSSTISYTQVPGVPSGATCYSSTSTAIYTGPVDSSEPTYVGSDETGSYDGSVTATNNNDFTAKSFAPTGATFQNSSSIPGSPSGNTLTGTASNISVPNEIYYDNSANHHSATVSLDATAPAAPAGWTVKVCPNNAGVPDCTNSTGTFASIGGAGSTTTSTITVAKGSVLTTQFWAVYTAPSGTVAFQRYDAVITATDGTNANSTHSELYAGFMPLTKNMSVVSTGCPTGASVPASGACPGGVVKDTIDYRNIMVGAGLGTESSLASAFLKTSPGSLVLADDGTLSTSPSGTINNWATFSKGLKEQLSAGVSNTACGSVANTCGDTTSGTIFTYFTGIPASATGSTTYPAGTSTTKFSAQIGGSAFGLYPANFAGQTSQGTITFAVVVK